MDDELPFDSYITKRGRKYYYVRRIPDDIADCFSTVRIQRSLRTDQKAAVPEAAILVHREVEQAFAAARRRKGLSLNVVATADWDWSDWEQLAEWFKLALLEEDWRLRLRNSRGAVFDDGVAARELWRDNATVKNHIALQSQLRGMRIDLYLEQRFPFVQAMIRRVGVPLARSNSYFEPFMTACLKGELEYLATFFAREGGRLEEFPHPDSVRGKWRVKPEPTDTQPTAQVAAPIAGAADASKLAGHPLSDCLEKWEKDRKMANKAVTVHGIQEKVTAIAEFEAHSGVKDIGEIKRSQIIAFRDMIFDKGKAAKTVNKKVGQITTLLATAHRAGWIEHAISGNIHIDVPKGQSEREPFSVAELKRIFDRPLFKEGQLPLNPKAGGDLAFWIPVISFTSGLISSEILQLDADSIAPHPEAPEILCYMVTNAGGRSIKALARKRYVPVRQELVKPLQKLIERARKKGWTRLWKAVEERNNITSVSNMYSAFWSEFLREEIGIKDPQKTLYSFRHFFRDRIAAVGADDFEQNRLMGHAEVGTGKKYGAKKTPRVVDIRRLHALVQSATFPYLEELCWPE